MVNSSPTPPPGALSLDTVAGILGVDIETTSAADLKEYGAWAYSRHPSTRVLVLSWKYAETHCKHPVRRWVPKQTTSDGIEIGGEPLPVEIHDYVKAGGRLLAHNQGFEISVWRNILVPFFGFPEAEWTQWNDTQALGCAANFPSKLEGLAGSLGTPVQKDKAGYKLMLKLSKAKTVDGEFVYPPMSLVDFAKLAQYCDDDVDSMMGAWFALQKLKPAPPLRETMVWRLDQRINARGVFLDQALARDLRVMGEERSSRLASEAQRASLFELKDAVAPPALKSWLRGKGVKLPKVSRKNSKGEHVKTESVGAKEIGKVLEDPELDPVAREVLNIRLEATKATSLRKLRRVETMVGADGRLRNALKFCAAHTGRWSSSGLQIHNLPKDKLSPAASRLVSWAVEQRNVEALEAFEKRPLQALSSKLRSVVAAAPGHDLIAADFASIEACVLAWLSGQEDKLDFLHDYFRELARYERGERLTKPQDLYEFAAESIGSDQRPLGKVAELALGYGMGDFRFFATAAEWGVPIELKLAGKVKRAWRATNRMIVDFWKDLESACHAAVAHRGTSHSVGFLRVYASSKCMFIVLPSGRRLRYWRPSIATKTKTVRYLDADGEIVEAEFEGPELSFWTQNDGQNGMALESTYGGKLVENVTQAVARDLLAEAMLALDPLYPIVIHVHDSAAGEVPEGTGDVREFCEIMQSLPAWAVGCPVSADGYRAKRFRG